MARRQQFLHELLKEDQEPFRLETYIADRRSQLQKLPPPALRRTSPDVRKSPLFEDEDDGDDDYDLKLLNRSCHRGHSENTSADMKKLARDLIFEGKSETARVCDNEAVTRRICKRLDSWREVELNTIDTMIGFEFKSDRDGWMRFNEQAKEDVPGEIEVAIYSLLVEELSDELL